MAATPEFNFYERMFTMIGDTLNTYVNDTATNIIDAIQPVAVSLIAIYIMFWGWAMMRGMIQEPVTDGFTRMIRITVIIAIALNIGHYNGFLSDWLWNIPDELIAKMGLGDEASSSQYLDDLTHSVFEFKKSFSEAAYSNGNPLGIPDLGLMATGWLVFLMGLAATAYAAFLLVLSKIALAVLLGIGPIFVLALLFDATKQFFNTWIGQAINYIFLVLLAAATVKVILAVLESYLGAVTSVSDDPGINHAVPAIAFSGVGLLVLVQMPSIASALGGGVAVGTLGAANALYGKVKGGAKDSAKFGKGIATGQTVSDMRGRRRTKQLNANWASKNPSRTRQLYQKAVQGRGDKPNTIEKKR